jgi:hypothetical protein
MEDEDLYSLMKPRVRELPSRPSFYRTTKRQMQKDFEDPLRRTRMGEIYAAGEWMALYKKYDGIYRFGVLEREVEQIQTAFAKFEDTVDHRRKMVYALRKNIERADVHILEYPINSAPWRFTFYTSNNMTGEDTMNLAEALRKGGLDVNQLYIPLHWLAPVKTVTDGCPVAEYAGVRTINIRVDQDTTEDHARIAGEIIMSLAK